MSLQDELEQAKICYEATAKGIAELESRRIRMYNLVGDLKKKIADSVVTYSIGDRFEITGEEFLMVSFSVKTVALICTREGLRLNDAATVEDCQKVTRDEFLMCLDEPVDFFRTWDARKQCECGSKKPHEPGDDGYC